MSISHWINFAARLFHSTKRNSRRRAGHRVLATLDALEPRALLSATALGEIPGVRFGVTGDSTEVELDQFFDDPDLSGSIVQIETGSGSFYIETYDTITPITAGNFLSLVTGGNYDDMFFHRSDPDFVLQGGGFTFPETSTTTRDVVNNGTIVNEFDNWFDPELGGLNAGDPVNVRGTIAMAKIGGAPDSATSQWFISVADNQNILDPQNGGFTVFAHVLFDGMDVVDGLLQLEIANAGGSFTELPVVDLDVNATSIERENLVLTTSTIVNELQYTTSTSDFVTATVVDGKLQLTATEAGISQGGTAQISVTAIDLQGNEVISTIDVLLAEPTVTGPTEVASSLPTITWTAAADAESYDLRIDHLDDRFTDVIQTDDIVSENGITGTSFTATESLPDGQYKASVRKHTASGAGEFSAEFLFYIGLSQPATVATPVVTPSGDNDQDVAIAWTAAQDATHYDIWISEVGGNVVEQVDWVSGTSYSPMVQLQAGRSYRVWVRGRNALETGTWSSGTRFVSGTAIPEKLTITPPESGVVGTNAPTLAWAADDIATEYEVYIAAAGSNTAAVRLDVSDTSFTPPNTLADGFYRAWVRAKNGNGSGPWSSALNFGITASDAASVVTGPTGDANSNQPEITWTAGIPGGTYELWVNQVGGQARLILESGIAANSFTPPAALTDGSYIAWVRQTPSSGGALPWSPAFRFEVGASTTPEQPTLTIDTSSTATTFSWQTVANAVRYELWVNLDNTRVLHLTDLTSLEHVTSELQAVGSHRAWLRGINEGDVAGAWSSVVVFSI